MNQPILYLNNMPDLLFENFPYGAFTLNKNKNDIIASINQGKRIILYILDNILFRNNNLFFNFINTFLIKKLFKPNEY